MAMREMLGKLLHLGESEERPRVDVALGDPDAARLRSALEEGRWDAVRDFLDDPALTWDDRSFFVSALGEWRGRPAWIDAWVAAEPKCSAARLLRGAHDIVWAWEARGTGLGASVSQKNAELFFERMEMSERDLYDAAKLAPEDPTPWAIMITGAMGLGLEAEESRARFEAAIQRDPLNRHAHSRMLNALTAKWGGAHEAMFEFARASAEKAPEGHGLWTLVPQAHVERWLYCLIDQDFDAAERYFLDPETRREVRRAADRSILSPERKPARRERSDLGYFAFCFWMSGEQTLAKKMFEQIGPWVDELPWGYLGHAAKEFARARRQIMKSK